MVTLAVIDEGLNLNPHLYIVPCVDSGKKTFTIIGEPLLHRLRYKRRFPKDWLGKIVFSSPSDAWRAYLHEQERNLQEWLEAREDTTRRIKENIRIAKSHLKHRR